jgi:chaperonin cofactor prefoldin
MPEDISVQVLVSASENIQKLFDLSTRIDERVKAIQDKQSHMDRRIDEVIHQNFALIQKVAVLESKDISGLFQENFDEMEQNIEDLDRRLLALEGDHGRHNERWNKIGSFVIQLIWVVLAAYILTKLHLQAPSVP